jgi:hypothetical protein
MRTEWREILTVRTDEPISIPRENIRFVDDQICLFFHDNYYAVTSDSGRSWSIWDAQEICLTDCTTSGPTSKTCVSRQVVVEV